MRCGELRRAVAELESLGRQTLVRCEMSSKPLTDRRQVEEYVERELREATLPGWKCMRADPGRLWWSIKKTSISPGEWPEQEYGLHVTDDLHWFIVTYENHDVGPGSLQQEFQKARVISSSSLEHYPLGSCIQFIVEHCKPNEWGYT